MSIEAPQNILPPPKFCDITGYEVIPCLIKTKYKDKETGLYYFDKIVFNYVKSLPKPYIDQYLQLRKVTINY